MATEQIKDLIPVAQGKSAEEPIEIHVDPCPEPPAAPLDSKLFEQSVHDKEAAEILSAPKPPDPVNVHGATSQTLNTRKQLIGKIKELLPPEQYKPMNLGRRRKNSLKEIIGHHFAKIHEEAIDENLMPDVHPLLKDALPPGMEANQKFAIDMAFRLDMTLCAALEKGIDWADLGVTAGGFADSIQQNEVLSEEIKNCWQEILMEEDNQWLLEYCTATSRLVLCHFYGLINVLRTTQLNSTQLINVNNVRPAEFPRPPPRPIPRNAPPILGPSKPSGKLRAAALRLKKSREEHVAKGPVLSTPRRLVKVV